MAIEHSFIKAIRQFIKVDPERQTNDAIKSYDVDFAAGNKCRLQRQSTSQRLTDLRFFFGLNSQGPISVEFPARVTPLQSKPKLLGVGRIP